MEYQPKFYEYYNCILECLVNGPLKRNELFEKVAIKMNLSEQTKAEIISSGDKVYKNRIGWAQTYLSKGNYLEKIGRGIYQITDKGRGVLQKGKILTKEEVGKYYKNQKDTISKALEIENKTPYENIIDNFNIIKQELKYEILSEIMEKDYTFFEELVLKLMEKMGYGNGKITAKTNDYGIDGIINEDRLGFGKIYVQAKRYKLDISIGRPEIQAFVGAIARKDGKGLFVATCNFSKQASEYAINNNIILIDGSKLADLMIEYNLGVSISNTYFIKKIDSDFWE